MDAGIASERLDINLPQARAVLVEGHKQMNIYGTTPLMLAILSFAIDHAQVLQWTCSIHTHPLMHLVNITPPLNAYF